MTHLRSPALDESGFVVLDRYDQAGDPEEWRDLEYTGWRSSGVTRFAPLASYDGSIDCNAFWNRTPPRTDRDGVWIDAQVERAPILVRRAQAPGANVGRCRVVELQPNTYADALYNLHRDDNNRLNPEGAGWIVRAYENLSDDPDSVLILRTDPLDAASEVRLPLPAGCRLVIDTQRFWHAVWHRGETPRYALITSWTSGPELDAYITAQGGVARVESPPIDPALAASAEAEVRVRNDERRRMLRAFAGDSPS